MTSPLDASAATPRTDEASDAALARRAGLGDREAFSLLFTRHWYASYRFAAHMLNGDEHAAEDAAQEAWVSAWKNVAGFRGEAAFRTWVLRITARRVEAHRRRRRPVAIDDAAVMDILDRNPDHDSDPNGPEDAARHQATVETLMIALTELPWRQRAAWLLREFDELSYEEIADVLGTTPTVVRGQLHRARRSLARRMEQWR